MYHKDSYSARLRFLKLDYGGVCGFTPMPRLAQIIEPNEPEKVVTHPAHLLKEAEDYLGSKGILEAEGEFRVVVDVPNGPIQVFLARFTEADPPFKVAEEHDAEFIELPQAINLPDVELELLREVYTLVIGG